MGMQPSHPGEILREDYVQPLGLTITDLAKGLKMSRKTLSAIVHEKAAISSEIAIKLSVAFNTTPEFWVNLQQQFDLWLAQQTVDTASIREFWKLQETIVKPS